jgi:predicted DNA binding protein
MSANGDEPFVELTFRVEDDAYPTVRVTDALDCRVELLDAAQASDDGGTVFEFVRVEGAPPADAAEEMQAADLGVDATVVEAFDGEAIVELVQEQSVVGAVADAGAFLESATATDGVSRVVAVFPACRDSGSVAATVRARNESVAVVSKQYCSVPTELLTGELFGDIVESELTDRQWEAVRGAFHGGYFDRPRGSTQSELAAEMGVAPSTFGQHLNSGLRKILATLFEV